MIGKAGILFGDDVATLVMDYANHAASYGKNAPGDLFSDKEIDPKVAQRRRAIAAKGMAGAFDEIVRLIALR